MIEFVKGDIFESGCEALVNPVNLQGVMGNGLAKQFKDMFPTNYKLYRQACLCGAEKGTIYVSDMDKPWWQTTNQFGIGSLCCIREMLPGRVFATPVTIVNFPTKTIWREPSHVHYIKMGLITLRDFLSEGKVKSIAIPSLGCGKGKLDWVIVKQLIVLILNDVDNVDIKVYEPIE